MVCCLLPRHAYMRERASAQALCGSRRWGAGPTFTSFDDACARALMAGGLARSTPFHAVCVISGCFWGKPPHFVCQTSGYREQAPLKWKEWLMARAIGTEACITMPLQVAEGASGVRVNFVVDRLNCLFGGTSNKFCLHFGAGCVGAMQPV